MADDRKILTFDEAMALVPEGDAVHTFSNPAPGVMVGADWSRQQIIDAIRQNGAELAGATARNFGHGLCLVGQRLFIATRPLSHWPDIILTHTNPEPAEPVGTESQTTRGAHHEPETDRRAVGG